MKKTTPNERKVSLRIPELLFSQLKHEQKKSDQNLSQLIIKKLQKVDACEQIDVGIVKDVYKKMDLLIEKLNQIQSHFEAGLGYGSNPTLKEINQEFKAIRTILVRRLGSG